MRYMTPTPPPEPIPAADPAGDVPGRLLAAAAELFAEHGYDGTTIRDVVARARTNLNAVNYHFGSKEQLYGAVMQHLADRAEAAHPRHQRGAARDAEELLAWTIEDTLAWLLDPDSPLPAIYARELVTPGPGYSLANVGKAEHENLQLAVTALLGPGAAPTDIAHVCRSIYSQCAYFMFIRRLLPMMDPTFRYSPASVRALAEHITAFSLGGIAAVRQRAGAGTAGAQGHGG